MALRKLVVQKEVILKTRALHCQGAKQFNKKFKTVKLNLNVSCSTIYRVIKNCRYLKNQKMKAVPRLTMRHKAARREFARKTMNRDWSKVIKNVFPFYSAYAYYCCFLRKGNFF